MNIIDGKKIAQDFLNNLKEEVVRFQQKQKRAPGLAVVLVGQDPASQIYVRNKRTACQKIGMESFSQDLPETTSEAELMAIIDALNHDPRVDGILVQLPLPKHMKASAIINAIAPEKDVDGFHPMNAGRLFLGEPGLRPCTPLGVIHLLKTINCSLSGKHAVIVGKSNIVGKPMAAMLLEEHATVTICHSR
ncbi:MAG: bifunctional methylenetetrahydrofolate dehydrogenase/methenyltetrahydrofolate cyclohydrolase, partial [Deltaproteobacteria bacterium]|nr:bifunctional methylenetetrahydrofolate dehydrogenase/methenyltetrahydrofolate cyclohydrolase [Deltaproteobacteria bacterium]